MEKPNSGKNIFAISKELNKQSTEILDYLKLIGAEVAGIMSKVDETVYRKILSHFNPEKTEIEKRLLNELEEKKRLIEQKKAQIELEKIKKRQEIDRSNFTFNQFIESSLIKIFCDFEQELKQIPKLCD